MSKQLPIKERPLSLMDNDFVVILFYEAQSLLILEWKRQITLPERRAGFIQALSFTNQYQAKYWLVDCLQVYAISEQEKDWLLTEWIAVVTQSPILKLAVVWPDFYPALMASMDFTHQIKEQYLAKGDIQHEVLMDYMSAWDWLFPDNNH